MKLILYKFSLKLKKTGLNTELAEFIAHKLNWADEETRKKNWGDLVFIKYCKGPGISIWYDTKKNAYLFSPETQFNPKT